MAYKHNGKTLQVGRSFILNQIQYPANWLQKSTEAERTAVGITWEDDPVRADDRYYWNGNINTPKTLDDIVETVDGESHTTKGLKSNLIEQVKHTTGTILAQTDWYVTRKSEKGTAIPADVETKRNEVRTECDRLEVAIAAVTTVEELITVMNSQDWGE